MLDVNGLFLCVLENLVCIWLHSRTTGQSTDCSS